MTRYWPAAFLTSSLVVAPLLFVAAPAGAQVPPGAPTLDRPAPPSSAGLPIATFPRLFRGFLTDIRRLPSPDSLKWLSAAAVASALGHAADSRVSTAMSGSSVLNTALGAGDTIGSARFQFGGALTTYAVGRVSGNRRIAALGGDLVRAQALAQTVTQAVKAAARRTRPDGGNFSFPSGHSSTAFASAAVLQHHLGWRGGVPAYAAAAYVAASRIQDRRHFLTDVGFGAVLGIVAGRTVTVGRGDARFSLSPVARPGGGGVSFSWLGTR